jgi:hypothetical protein
LLQIEEALFEFQTAGVSDKFSVGADYPVAGMTIAIGFLLLARLPRGLVRLSKCRSMAVPMSVHISNSLWDVISSCACPVEPNASPIQSCRTIYFLERPASFADFLFALPQQFDFVW